MPALEKRLKETRERKHDLRFISDEMKKLQRLVWCISAPKTPSECSMINSRIRYFKQFCDEIDRSNNAKQMEV